MRDIDMAKKGHLTNGVPLLANTTPARRRNTAKRSQAAKSFKNLPPAPVLNWGKKK